jgi:hypothetical protein
MRANTDGSLLVGAPGEKVRGQAGAGAVARLPFVFPAGLTVTGSVEITQATPGIPGSPRRGDHFGATVGIGERGPEVIAAPGEDVNGAVDAGGVTVMFGVPGGAGASAYALTQDSPRVPGKAEAGDHFGAALAFSNSCYDGEDEENGLPGPFVRMIVGAPGEDVGSVRNAGGITIFNDIYRRYRDRFDWELALSQDTPGVSGRSRTNDRFGSSLDANWGRGLLVGIPGKDVGGAKSAGAVSWLDVAGADCPGPEIAGSAVFTQESAGVPGTARQGNLFGSTVSAGSPILQFPAVESDWFVIGAPGVTVAKHRAAGTLTILTLLTLLPPPPLPPAGTLLSQNSPAVPGQAEAGDRFGSSLSG